MSGTLGGTVTVGRQGRVVLPAAVRRALDLETGDELVVHVEGGRVVLEPRETLLGELQDELRSARGSRSVVDELIADRRREAARERR